ncbi:unnamed protein product [Lota lota]
MVNYPGWRWEAGHARHIATAKAGTERNLISNTAPQSRCFGRRSQTHRADTEVKRASTMAEISDESTATNGHTPT